MTVATNRPDGWPQATTVGYVNDGLKIYFLCSPQSQKAANLARDNRISLSIDHDVSDPMAINGPCASRHRSDRNSKGVKSAGDEIPRIRGLADAKTRGNCGLPGRSEGDLGSRLLEGLWSLRPCDDLADWPQAPQADRTMTRGVDQLFSSPTAHHPKTRSRRPL